MQFKDKDKDNIRFKPVKSLRVTLGDNLMRFGLMRNNLYLD